MSCDVADAAEAVRPLHEGNDQDSEKADKAAVDPAVSYEESVAPNCWLGQHAAYPVDRCLCSLMCMSNSSSSMQPTVSLASLIMTMSDDVEGA